MYRFGGFGPSLDDFLSVVDFHEKYPMAFLDEIKISCKHQRQGYGGWLLNEFEKVARSERCSLALGRLGFQENSNATYLDVRAKNERFYRKHSWVLSEPRENCPILILKCLETLPSDPPTEIS